MATFIPARVGALGARSIHIKRALGRLSDDYVVRTPLRPAGWAPDFFIQHPVQGWLAIAVSDAPYEALAADQLFGDGESDAFDVLLARMAALPVPAKLVVLWTCSAEEVRRAAARYEAQWGLRLVSKAEFLDNGETLLPRLAAPIATGTEQALMAQYFAEAEIAASCTTRRHFNRDNTATLQRYFLDVQQESAAKQDLLLPQGQAATIRDHALPQEQAAISRDIAVRLVNGVAGSGKTLIALSRALLLAELHPQQRILVLIHNAPVVADVNAQLRRIREGSGLPANLEINTFSAWVHRQWRNVHQRYPHMPPNSRMVEELIQHFRSGYPELRLPVRRLREELDFINESLITSEAQYCHASRSGRGFALRPAERNAVWALHGAVTASLRAQGMSLWSALPLDISQSEDRHRLEKYHHVLMDEAQFCAPSWFHMVRLAMHPGSSLFLCADPNQGFMKSRLSWKSVGLDVAGRTRKLRKSYRTTQANLASASMILSRHTQGDPEDFLVPDLDGMEPGVKPALVYTDSPQDAVDRLVNELGACVQDGRFALSDLLVIYGDQVQKTLLYGRLCQRFGAGSVWWLNKSDQRKAPPGGVRRSHLRLANLDTATGLEAGVVFLIGVEKLLAVGRYAGVDLEENARKLYMAMTRAGLRLVVISSERVQDSIRDAFTEWTPPAAGQ
ncbi:hypothetical protein GCM10027277_34370 [Pseudoduganella ginsengisoli]|uniref:hypothetical protein n=1 Tax=Pseudoduganella ginsengisoli TaxID=1462440 RepID=UPI001BAE327F|nr:hypothetical protein [Pseudoduganella ginsengisoli]